MSITIESLTNHLNALKQQQAAASNMAQQCAGAIGVVEHQLSELRKEAEEFLKANADLLQKENEELESA